MTPNEDKQLSFSLAIPKTWAYSAELGPVLNELLHPRGIGLFTGSMDAGTPIVAVTVTTVPFEVPVDQWVRQSLSAEGWTIEQANWYPGKFGDFFDVTGTRIFDGVAEVRRTSARNDGPNIFCVNSMCSRERWEDAKEDFWVAHCTFELLGGQKTARMEAWATASANGPNFHAAHPYSWDSEGVSSSSPGVSAVDIRLTDAAKATLLAYLQIKAEISLVPPALETLRADTMGRIQKLGFEPDAHPKLIPPGLDQRSVLVEGWLGAFDVRGKIGQGNAVARMGFIHREGLTFTLALIGPTLRDQPLVYLRALKAFEIARNTIDAVKD
jgi:hypothetical protein